MARKPLKASKLIVSISPIAMAALADIWHWNTDRYGLEHADAYQTFLLAQVEKLSITYFAGQAVPTRPRLSFITIRRRRNGHGHVVVYERTGQTINVLRFFHTAQDWQRKV